MSHVQCDHILTDTLLTDTLLKLKKLLLISKLRQQAETGTVLRKSGHVTVLTFHGACTDKEYEKLCLRAYLVKCFWTNTCYNYILGS